MSRPRASFSLSFRAELKRAPEESVFNSNLPRSRCSLSGAIYIVFKYCTHAAADREHGFPLFPILSSREYFNIVASERFPAFGLFELGLSVSFSRCFDSCKLLIMNDRSFIVLPF